MTKESLTRGPAGPLPGRRRHPKSAVLGIIAAGVYVFCSSGAVNAQDQARTEVAVASKAAIRSTGNDGMKMHGIAMHGLPRMAAGFRKFSYASPDAPKGGRLTLGTSGTFDSLNPFIIRGVTPPGIRGRVYESLMARALDEPFTLYGLIARSIEVPDDRSSITFTLRKEARFSDGTPLTADDVLFSHKLLRDKGRPYLRSHYRKVVEATKLAPDRVRFRFKDGSDREIALIMGLMPILPKHATVPEEFEKTSLQPPIGSGPYVIASDGLEPGRELIYRRNPSYWGKDLAVNSGRNNFDEIRYIYFRNNTALFEAFKVGDIDLRSETDPGRWAEGYGFPAAKDGRVLRRAFDIGLPAGMTGLAMNSRRAAFEDQRVRQALILLFDFEWINRVLYHGLYKRTQSFFERSALSSSGKAVDAAEQALLAPFRGMIKPAILDGSYSLAKSDGSGRDRRIFRKAFNLLRAAGYVLKGKTLVHKASGKALAFEFLARTNGQKRMMLSYKNTLSRLGIKLDIRHVDDAQYWSRLKTFDYDMIQWRWGASLSPGNEQINRWSSKAAAREGSLNFANARSPAADAMIDALLAAKTDVEFVSAVRAFDRALLSGDYVIPLFHLPKLWVAHWAYLKFPKTAPLWGYSIDHWWREDAK